MNKPIRINRAVALAPQCRQQGVALAISLVLLVAMTILGVATLSNTRLNEKITGNAQQKAISFEVAESAIYSAWSVDALMDIVEQIPVAQYNDPDPIEPAGLAASLSADLDQKNDDNVNVVDVDVELTIQYCGESVLPDGSNLSADESDVQLVGLLFDVNGVAEIDNTNTRADHVQRGALVRPKTGRTGDCVIPGM